MSRRKGFTLVEMIAVLAILAILASAIAPNIASELKRARTDAEDQSLSSIGTMLTAFVQSSRHHIPGSARWADSVARLATSPVADISTNQDNFARVYVTDLLWAPAGTRPPAAGWTQTPALVWAMGAPAPPPPSRCRILILSGTQADLTAACAGLTAAQFDLVWNRAAGAPAACVEGPNVRLGRVNLTGQFQQVTLSASATGWFTFDGDKSPGTPVNFAATTRTFPVLSGTRLSLLDAGGGGVLTEFVINRPVSVNWDGFVWVVH